MLFFVSLSPEHRLVVYVCKLENSLHLHFVNKLIYSRAQKYAFLSTGRSESWPRPGIPENDRQVTETMAVFKVMISESGKKQQNIISKARSVMSFSDNFTLFIYFFRCRKEDNAIFLVLLAAGFPDDCLEGQKSSL